MAETLNWHDAHALLLIDRALEQGRFTEDLVSEISEALQQAEAAMPADRPAGAPS
jgi:hypothetical protein